MLFKPYGFDFKFLSSLRLTPKTALTLVLLSSLASPVLGMDVDREEKKGGTPTAQQPVTTPGASSNENGGTKRTRPGEENTGERPAKKQRTTKELLTPAKYLELFKRNFIKLRNMGDSEEEALGNRQLAIHLSARYSEDFFVLPEHKDVVSHLMAALAGDNRQAEQFAGTCYVTAVPSEIIETILTPGLITPNNPSWEGIRAFMNLRRVNKFLLQTIDYYRFNNNRFFTTFEIVNSTWTHDETWMANSIKAKFLMSLSKAFPKIKNLTVRELYLTHDYYEAWQNFTFLQKLDLETENNANIDNKAFDFISPLTSLTSLRLSAGYTHNITDSGLHSLSTLTNLTELSLECIASISHLPTLTGLKKLNFTATTLTHGTAHLSLFTNLTSLDLTAADITNGGVSLRPLSLLTKLEELFLGRNEKLLDVWDNGVVHQWPEGTGLTYLTGLTNLKMLEMGGDSCHEYEDVPDIKLLSHLKQLKITNNEE